jgi:hypothetical protein
MQDRFQHKLYQNPVLEQDMFDDYDLTEAYENIDELDKFEAYCQDIPKILLHETTEIYRSVGWNDNKYSNNN